MITSSNIVEKLKDFVKSTEIEKSSHWESRLKSMKYDDFSINFGFGSFEEKNFFKSILHFLFSRILFGLEIFKSEETKVYKNIFNIMNRQIDVDAMRHIYTFNKLKKNIVPKKICTIGDGKANFVLGCLKIYPEAQIYSVNLPEVLIHDYSIISKYRFIEDANIEVVSNKKNLENLNKKLFLIPSSNIGLLLNFNIDLFVNIVSFQEMNMKEIIEYFKIIKSNKSKLYACNREKKILSGGEVLKFKDYPWGNGKKIFEEDCPWHQKYYSFKPIFFHKYDGNIKHCLIDYSTKT